MKKNILSTLFAGFAVLLAACTSDLSDNPISTTVPGNSILQLEITQSEETRGVITSKSFQEGDSVLVVIADMDKDGDLTEMRKATYIGGKWVLDTELDFSKPISGLTWSDNTNVEVYYPYDIVNYPYDKSKGYFELDNLLSQTDILVGYVKEVNSKNPVAKVTCRHAMTRLTFVLKNNSDQPAKIDKYFIEPGNQPFIGIIGYLSSSGLFNIGYEYMISEECNIEIAGGESYNMDLLIAPTSEAYKRMNDEGYDSDTWAVVLTINGSQTFFQIPVASWEAGQQYTYPVTLPDLKKPELTGEIDGHEYVDLGCSVLWATCNIGAETPYESGLYFQWGETSGYSVDSDYWADQDNAYTFKNWTLDAFLQENVILPQEDGTYLLNSAYDAAHANWKGGWRMPTESELKELVSNCYFRWDSTNKGMIVHSYRTGQEIFLPAAAYIVHGIQPQYTSGDYWSSNFDITTYNEYGRMNAREMLFIEQSSGNYAGSGISTGIPIRPVIAKE